MASFDLPRTTSKNFGSTPQRPKTPSRSPGPAAYESAHTPLTFSSSMVSRASNTGSATLTGRFAVPGELRAKSENAKMAHAHEAPTSWSLGKQEAESRRKTAPSFSMTFVKQPTRPRTPGPCSYRPSTSRGIVGASTWGVDDRFGAVAGSRTAAYSHVPHSSSYQISHALTLSAPADTDNSTPFCGRIFPKGPERLGPGPQPSSVGAGADAAKSRVLSEAPKYTIGIRAPGLGLPPKVPDSPGVQKYDARSLYWATNRSQLGRAQTAMGRSRSAVSLSLHKDVQAAQPATMRR